ncbi:MAG: hypothetical protein M3R61_00025 [Chloroflexota bacterium]|nr:hypothetical protein [Chloroflexota bacterium]
MEKYTTEDVRDLDCVFLATIAGADYYELRQIMRVDGQQRAVIGRASDWPMIQRDAENAELAALLTASERRSLDADTHCVELLSRLSAYAEHIAALEACLADANAPAPQIAPPEAAQASIAQWEAPDDGKVPCDHPGCHDRVKLQGRGAHKRHKHGVAGLIGHKPSAKQASAITPSPNAWALAESPWRCAECGTDTHAPSIERTALCIRCVVAAVEPRTNGHRAVA